MLWLQAEQNYICMPYRLLLTVSSQKMHFNVWHILLFYTITEIKWSPADLFQSLRRGRCHCCTWLSYQKQQLVCLYSCQLETTETITCT